jgi:hypothetical protein
VSTSGDIWPAPPTSTAETTFQELVKDQQPPQTSSTSKNADSEAIDRKAVLNLVKGLVLFTIAL